MSKKLPKDDVTKYDKKSPREHILLRPDTYIGDIEPTTEKMWIWKESKIVKEDITYTPGFLKIFDEILVNARDASVNDSTCDTIKVSIDKEKNEICVWSIRILSHIIKNFSKRLFGISCPTLSAIQG